MYKTVAKLFGFDSTTYQRWKREKRIIMTFVHNYFSKDELIEINANNGRLEKLDIIKNISLNELIEKLDYADIYENKIQTSLKLFERGSLLYLKSIFEKQKGIIDYKSIYKFIESKNEPKKLLYSMLESLNDFEYHVDTEDIVRKGFSKKLHDDLSKYMTNNQLDYLIKNKQKFIDKINLIIREKT
jgi:hypothetical protein